MSTQRLQLGRCIYNPATRILRQPNGQEEQLSHIPADLLKLLYTNKHRYISNQELQNTIWAERIIEERSIMRCISTVRKALGESTKYKYIETRRNEGYRFVAEVKDLSTQTLNDLTKPVAIGILSAFFFMVIYSFFLPQHGIKPETLTSLIGQEIDGSMSGDVLLFSHKPQNEEFWSLYAKNISNDRYFKLTAGEHDDRRAVFSPDGTQIAYQRHDGEHCQIVIANFNPLSMTLEAGEVVYHCLDELLSVSISWKDEDQLYLSYTNSLSSPYQIFLYNLESKETTVISEPPSHGQGDYYSNYSQAANRLAYFRNIGDSITEIWLYDPKNNTTENIATIPLTLYTLAWVDDGNKLVIRTGNGQLSLIDINNGNSISKLLEVNYPIRFVFAINNDTIGYVHGHMRVRNILKVKIDEEPEIVASSSFQDYLPVYSEQSDSMVFVSNRSGEPQIWLSERGNIITQLTHFTKSYRIAHMALSRDGQLIAYTINTQIHIIDKQGKPLFSSEDGVVYKNPVFSNDGSKLYYSINYQGTWRVESRHISNLNTAVTLADGYIIKPCPDADCLYIMHRDDPILYKLEKGITTNTGIDLGDIQYPNQFEIFDDSIYYVNSSAGTYDLMHYELNSQQRTMLSPIPTWHFSIDKNDLTIYTTSMNDAETVLEQAQVPAS